MKETLHSKCIGLVEHHLHGGVMSSSNYKKISNSLHSAAVAKAICSAGPNEVLGHYPPSAGVNSSEKTLSRSHRCTLAQLRSSYCHHLCSYLHAIGKTADDLCPECGVASHSPAHLFECRAFPTDLTVKDLWTNPRDAAIFISNLPSFIHHLPPVAPLPLRIPPEPPP